MGDEKDAMAAFAQVAVWWMYSSDRSDGGSPGNSEMLTATVLRIRESIPKEMTAESGFCPEYKCHGTLGISGVGERDRW